MLLQDALGQAKEKKKRKNVSKNSCWPSTEPNASNEDEPFLPFL